MTAPTIDQLRAALEQQEAHPDDGVMVFVFAAGEPVPADHPAVLAAPECFVPLDDGGEAA